MLGPTNLLVPSFLMCPPFALEGVTPDNIFMQDMPEKDRKVDRRKALRQFLDLYNFVASIALVYLLPSRKGLQDQSYVANLGLIPPHWHDKKHIIIANFRAEPRRDEPAVGMEFFKMMGYSMQQAPKYFEGEADVKFLRDNIYFGAWGIRTNIKALKWLRDNYDMNIIPIHMKDPYFYHLDCKIFIISREKVMLQVDDVEERTIKQIERVAEIVPIHRDIALSGVFNCLRIRRLVLTSSNVSELKASDEEFHKEKTRISYLSKICADNGLEPVLFNLSEFDKSGADLGCQFLHLNYADYLPGKT